VFLGLEVVGAVLEAHQVAWRGLRAAGRRGAAEAELGPANGGHPEGGTGQVADGVDGDLRADRAAFVVTAGDDGDAGGTGGGGADPGEAEQAAP
jgi:hypothetical protein